MFENQRYSFCKLKCIYNSIRKYCMKKHTYLIALLFLLNTTIVNSQEYTLFDFGSSVGGYTTLNNWNNLTNVLTDTLALINSDGTLTGDTLIIDDEFYNGYNVNGTTSPSGDAVDFPATATKDNFFGHGLDWNPFPANPTGGFTLSGLDPTKYYSFDIFASRTGVTDNRESLYTIVGLTTKTEVLNASNNSSRIAKILNVKPTPNGKITFSVQASVSNTSPSKFYYLGAIKMTSSIEPLGGGGTVVDPSLSVLLPNGGEKWEVGKTVKIQWMSDAVDSIVVEYSTNNGNSWNKIDKIPANQVYYNWIVPNELSLNAKIRISYKSISDQSDNSFSIIPNIGEVFRIVVLGSSTAAGTGPGDINNAWVWRYRDYLSKIDTRFDVVNLAVGGYTTYNILPTGTAIASGINRQIDINKNITKAVTFNPKAIIINMPSNDAASGYPVADQIANYTKILEVANTQNIPYWITTPQPRNFGANTTNLTIQLEMLNRTYTEFTENKTIDFWTDFGVTGGNGINPLYDTGDGIHINDAGHKILFDRVVAKDIHGTIQSSVDGIAEIRALDMKFELFPSVISNSFTVNFSLENPEKVNIQLFNLQGQLVNDLYNESLNNGSQSVHFKNISLPKGIYLCVLSTIKQTATRKLIVN